MVAILLGLPAAAPAQTIKPSTLVEHVKKGRFSEADREIAAKYLAKHADELPGAPAEAEELLRARGWADGVARYGAAVPEPLENKLSPPCRGIVREIFNRSLLNVREADGTVLDRVFARD